jgi:hypothetical protein
VTPAGAARSERLLLLATPVAAIAAVGLGLRIGAGGAVRAAVVYAAPTSAAGTGLAWQIVKFAEDHGVREPVALPYLEVVAGSGSSEAHVYSETNADGVAEVLLPLPTGEEMQLRVTSGAEVLAEGTTTTQMPVDLPTPTTAWARFARREGAINLDVAVPGQRAASGFPAHVWVRATDTSSHAPIAGAAVEPEPDSSFVPSKKSKSALTDARGWAEVVATPVGHAVTMILRARTGDGKSGLWAGALFISPGAADLQVPARVSPDAEAVVELKVPTLRTTGYLEIDDARGRAWATVEKLVPNAFGMPEAIVRVPRLKPGLYWAVFSSDPAGAALLGPGSTARPFAVAATDAEALSFGADSAECGPPLDPRDERRALSVCLALAKAVPVPRRVALEGFSMKRAAEARKRERGMLVAVGAIAVAVALETVLLLRAAAAARARLRAAAEHGEEGPEPARALVGPAWTVTVSVLVALLGLVLMAAYVMRVS